MENEAYKDDLWMWDQDWSVQSLKLKKSATKSKNTIQSIDKKDIIETIDNKTIVQDNVLSEEYIEHLFKNSTENEDNKYLNEKFSYLYELGKSLPVKRPYLAGYPAWYRKLCTKPGKDEDWVPGANNITTSMQVRFLFFFIIFYFIFVLIIVRLQVYFMFVISLFSDI